MKRLRFIIPVLLGLFINGFWNGKEITLSGVVLNFGFSSVDWYMPYITQMSFWYIPIFMAHVVFGTFIYRRFCSACVYYFSRTTKRKSWYLIESFKLYCAVLIYLVLLIGVAAGVPFLAGKLQRISAADIIVLLYYLALYSMYIFITAQGINLIAICSSSNIGFAVVELLGLTGFGFYSVLGEVFGENYIAAHTVMIRLNPAAHLIMDIHSSRFGFLNALINEKNIDFSLDESLIALGIAAVVTVIIGSVIVQYTNIIKQKQEGQ